MIQAQGLDGWSLELADAHRSSWLTSLTEGVQAVGTEPRWLALIAFVALVVVAVLRAWVVAAAVVVAVLVASAAVALLKPLIGRTRPPADLALVQLDGWSMPSSEAARTAAASTALVLTVVWASRRLMLACAALLVFGCLFVGVCMVYLGGHWPTDLVVGWVLGILIGSAVGLSARRLAGRPDLRAPVTSQAVA